MSLDLAHVDRQTKVTTQAGRNTNRVNSPIDKAYRLADEQRDLLVIRVTKNTGLYRAPLQTAMP